MKIHRPHVDRARQLRNNPTDAEAALWLELRRHQLGGHRFRRQHPIGNFIVDFVCLDRRLIVELDGGHHQETSAYDAARTFELNNFGFSVIRFWNNEVLGEMEGGTQVKPLSMSWCLDCHRNPAEHIRPRDEVTNMEWVAPKDQLDRAEAAIRERALDPPVDCSGCHR